MEKTATLTAKDLVYINAFFDSTINIQKSASLML